MPGFVTAILLKYTGDITTIKCNKKINIDTPQQKHFIGIKNKGAGEIGQIGSWDDVDIDGNIFYSFGWSNGTPDKKNGILLPPYDDIEFYNDIVIVKTDMNNNLCNLTEGEYETFYKEISGIIESDDDIDFSDGEEIIIQGDDADDDDVDDDTDDESEEEEEISNNLIVKNDSDELCLTDEEL